MKLDCAIVEDLYPLYMENELRPESKEAVDDHLEECKQCRGIYENGTGFSEMPSPAEASLPPAVPKTVDDKIRLRFRLRRMQLVAGLLAAVIIFSLADTYMDNRKDIGDRLNDVYRVSEELGFIAENPVNAEAKANMLSHSMERMNEFAGLLNWHEKRQLSENPLAIDIGGLERMARTLNKKKELGLTDKTDERALADLKSQIAVFEKEAGRQWEKFNHGYSSYFELVEIDKLSKPLTEINKTIYFYNRHHKAAADMKLLGSKEMKDRVRTILGNKYENIKLEKVLDNPVGYRFIIEYKDSEIDGEIDSSTGYITDVRINRYQESKPKAAADQEKIQEEAIRFLKRQYGQGSEFKIESAAEPDGNELSNYIFVPQAGSYSLHFPFELHFYMNFERKTGEFFGLHANSVNLNPDFFTFQPKDALGKDRAGKIAEKAAGIPVTYKATEIIFSSLEGGYVLAHIYEGNGQPLYINAENGRVEEPLFL